MREQGYQSKIMKTIEEMGGHCVNGVYSKSGEADLQCGYPVGDRLLYIAIEVKTEKDYYRVMRAIDKDYNIVNSSSLKVHEPLQIAKIRMVRNKGGLALVAFNIEQIKEYVNGKEIS